MRNEKERLVVRAIGALKAKHGQFAVTLAELLACDFGGAKPELALRDAISERGGGLWTVEFVPHRDEFYYSLEAHQLSAAGTDREGG